MTMHGFYNQIIIIDLTSQAYQIEPVADEIYQKYLGGKGLASWLLLGRNPKGVDPLSPENHLIFATGSATGSVTWGSSRYGVFTKSPLTGFYAESYSGGRVPEAISSTGFDAVVIKGRAKDLTLLEITPEGACFHTAEDLKGKSTFETETAVRGMGLGRVEKGWKNGCVVTWHFPLLKMMDGAAPEGQAPGQ